MKSKMSSREIAKEGEELVTEIPRGSSSVRVSPASMDENDYQILSSTMIPKKFVGLFLGDFVSVLKPNIFNSLSSYLKHFGEHVTSGRGIIFEGPIGTMKTSVTTLILKYAYLYFKRDRFFRSYIEEHKGKIPDVPIYFWQSGKFIMDYFRDKENFNWILSHPVLAIDDITKVTQEIYKEAFDYALRFREMNELPTILTSQVPLDGKKGKDGLLQFFGNPVYDLIRGNCEVIKLLGKSQRGKKKDG